MSKSFYVLILFSTFLYTGCKDKEEVFDPGYDYYPVSVGDYKVYNAQSVDFSPSDTIVENFEIKESVAEIFTINGETRYRLERYFRPNSSVAWPATPDSIWSVAVSKSKVVKVENNVRFVKLIFPIENGRTWNGNVENDWGADEYILKDLGKPFTLSSQTFENTVSVVQSPNDSSNYINKDFRMEVFSKGCGMIYKVKEVYDYKQNSDGTIDLNHKISDGIRYSEKLTSYGRE